MLASSARRSSQAKEILSRGDVERESGSKTIPFLLLLIIGFSVGVFRVEAEALSLVEAVEQARQQSPAVLESAAKKESARQMAKEARASRLPEIAVREIAVRTDSPADVFGMKLMQERFDFPAFTQSNPNEPDPLDDFTTEIEGTLPLFTGGRIRSGIGQADRMHEAAEAIHTHTQAAVDLMVANTYLDVLLVDEFFALSEKALETTQRHFNQAEDYFEAGMMVESDLLQAQVQLRKMEENLITVQNNARLARAGLNRVIGIEQNRTYDLIEPAGLVDIEIRSLEEALEQSESGRHDLNAVDLQVEAARLGIRRTQGEYFPELGLMAKYSLHDEKLFGDNGQSYMLVGRLNWKLWDWGKTRARVARSRSDHSAAEQSRLAYRQKVEFEVRAAWQAIEEARARGEVAQKTVESADRALSILEDRFSEGIAKVTDLLDAETEAHEARVRAVKARYDLQRSIRTLLFATGSTPVPEVRS